MFKNIFSFSGRIRRLEYGFSCLIFLGINLFLIFLFEEFEKFEIIFLSIHSVLYWFLLAQGSKRCHDLNNSGFYQFIPFYFLWMVFEEGGKKENQYGNNPKTIDSVHIQEKLILHSYLPNNKSLLDFVLETLSNVLVALFLFVFFTFSLDEYGSLTYFTFLLIIIPCYFLMLVINNKGDSVLKQNSFHIRQRMLYSILFYFLLRCYTIIFREGTFDPELIFFEIIIILLIYWLTYIPRIIYSKIYYKPTVNV